ncbi:MAG TPA: MarR family transcriptional regulator [Vicinamibacterales bacterium]
MAKSVMQGRGIIALMPLRDTMPQHYRLDPILDFMRLLWSVEHGLERMSKRMGSELGITGPQRLVLRVVGQFPDISAGDLSQIVRLHPSTMTGILQRLTDRGLLERTRDPRDSRRARLRLKPAAARFTRGTRFTVEKAVTQALEDVGPNSVRGARKVLGALARRLNDF